MSMASSPGDSLPKIISGLQLRCGNRIAKKVAAEAVSVVNDVNILNIRNVLDLYFTICGVIFCVP